jgi:MbtH protein
MTNPFQDEEVAYVVLKNTEGQYSLWPVFVNVPDGWTEVFRSDREEDSVAYIESAWTDMRPASLVRAMDGRQGP